MYDMKARMYYLIYSMGEGMYSMIYYMKEGMHSMIYYIWAGCTAWCTILYVGRSVLDDILHRKGTDVLYETSYGDTRVLYDIIYEEQGCTN